MGSLTIRNIEDELKRDLRVRGAMRGKSMEDEARSIIRAVLKAGLPLNEIGAQATLQPEPQPPAKQESAWDLIERLREKYGTFDLDLPPRTAMVGDSLKSSD